MTCALVKWVLLVGPAGLFFYAGIVKVWDPVSFMQSVETYRLFPHSLAVVATYYVPALEVVCAVGLVLPFVRRGAWWALTLLMVSFILMVTISWARGIDIHCGCFKPSQDPSSYTWLFVRDFSILAWMLFLGFHQKLIVFKNNS